MTKRLIDVGKEPSGAGRAELGAVTTEDVANRALHLAAADRDTRVTTAVSILADADLAERAEAWR